MQHVVHIRVPYYENLSLDDIFHFLNGHEEVMRHLPDGKELRKTPRQWIVNVIATIVGKPFKEWVKQRIDERNATVVEKNNLGITMDAQIAAAYHASTAVSGKSSQRSILHSIFL